MPSDFTHLYNTCAVPAFDKQLYLNDVVGPLRWKVDLETGRITFGSCLTWQTQLLGTESDVNRNWLWAWANPTPNIPPYVLGGASRLREMGEEHQIPEFTQPELSLEDTDGHSLALIASVVCDANAYYRAPYQDGALFLLIIDDTFRREISRPLKRILRVFPEAISALDLSDHRCALDSYLRFYDFTPVCEDHTLVVRSDDEPILTATFDEHQRLTCLEGTVSHDY